MQPKPAATPRTPAGTPAPRPVIPLTRPNTPATLTNRWRGRGAGELTGWLLATDCEVRPGAGGVLRDTGRMCLIRGRGPW